MEDRTNLETTEKKQEERKRPPPLRTAEQIAKTKSALIRPLESIRQDRREEDNRQGHNYSHKRKREEDEGEIVEKKFEDRHKHYRRDNANNNNNKDIAINNAFPFEVERQNGIPPLAFAKEENQLMKIWSIRTLKERFLKIIQSRQFYQCPDGANIIRGMLDKHAGDLKQKDKDIYDILHKWYHTDYMKR